MGLASNIQRALKTVVPLRNRAQGSAWISQYPVAAACAKCTAAWGALTTGAWPGLGKLVQLIATSVTDCWVEGILVTDPQTNVPAVGAGTFAVAVTFEAGTAQATPALVEALEAVYLQGATAATAIGPYAAYMLVNPPVHIPIGARLAVAVDSSLASKATAGPSCCVRLVLSHAK